jgi:hypothetical protein
LTIPSLLFAQEKQEKEDARIAAAVPTEIQAAADNVSTSSFDIAEDCQAGTAADEPGQTVTSPPPKAVNESEQSTASTQSDAQPKKKRSSVGVERLWWRLFQFQVPP